MFQKRIILIQLGVMSALLCGVFIIFWLQENGVISDDSLNYLVPTLMMSAAIVGWVLMGRFERGKTFGHLISHDLQQQGYHLLGERNLTVGEFLENLRGSPGILLNGSPLSSFLYKAQNERILHVKSALGNEFRLHVVITKTWKNKIEIHIVRKVRMDYNPMSKPSR